MNSNLTELDLGLSNIRDRQWAMFKCSGLKGWGLEEGLDWLVTIINQSINANIAVPTTADKKDPTATSVTPPNDNNVDYSPNNNNNNNSVTSDSPQLNVQPSDSNSGSGGNEKPAQ